MPDARHPAYGRDAHWDQRTAAPRCRVRLRRGVARPCRGPVPQRGVHRGPDDVGAGRAPERLTPTPDARFTGSPRPDGGNGHLAYIRKAKAGREIFYVVNSPDNDVKTEADLRGPFEREPRDPLRGTIIPAPCEVADTHSGRRTVAPLELGQASSMLLIGKRMDDG